MVHEWPSMEVFYSNARKVMGSRNFWRSEASKWETAVVMLRSGPRVPEGISRNGLPSCRRIKPMHICSLCSLFPPNILFWQDCLVLILWSRKTISRIISTFENVKFSRSIHAWSGLAGTGKLDLNFWTSAISSFSIGCSPEENAKIVLLYSQHVPIS